MFDVYLSFSSPYYPCQVWEQRYASLIKWTGKCSFFLAFIWKNLCTFGILSSFNVWYNFPLNKFLPRVFFLGRFLYYRFNNFIIYGMILIFSVFLRQFLKKVFIYFPYLFINFWLRWVLVAAQGIFVEACRIFSLRRMVCLGFSLVVACGLLSSCGVWIFSL